MTATVDQNTAIQDILNQLTGEPVVMNGFGNIITDSADLAGVVLKGIHDGVMMKPSLASKPAKAFTPDVHIHDPQVLASKDFWDALGSVIDTTVPALIGALTSKDWQGNAAAPPANLKNIAVNIPPVMRNDKDFWSFVGDTLQNIVPIAINAIQGKDFKAAIKPPTVPPGKGKDWVDTAVSVAGQALPFILSLF
jgi:hypothetical protein